MAKTAANFSSWPARSLVCLTLATLGWAAGYGLGRLPSRGPAGSSEGEYALSKAAPTAAKALSLRDQRQQLLAQPGGLARRLALLRLTDRASASGRGSLLNDPALSYEDSLRLVLAWAAEDPASCWNWEKQGGIQGMDFTGNIFEAWAKKDPEAAVAAARSAPVLKRWAAIGVLFSVWMKNESPAAGALAPQLDHLVSAAGGNTGSQWGIADKDGKLSARIVALPTGPAREGFLRGYAAGLFDKDWELAAEWVARLPIADRPAVMEDLVQSSLQGGRAHYYSGIDRKEPGPERLEWARRWLTEEADAATRTRLGPLYVESVARTDPGGAMAWAQETMSGLPLSQAVAKVVSTLAGKDRNAAASLIDSLPPGGVRMKATQALVDNWMNKDPTAAVDWARAQGKDAMNPDGWARLATKWAYQDPEEFKKYTALNLEVFSPSILHSAVDDLVRKDAAGTMAWAASLPVSARAEMVGVSFSQWTHRDPRAAAQYVVENPTAPLTANAVSTVTERLFARDAETAAGWAVSLPAGAGRDAALTKLRGNIASEKDPARRDDWLGRLGSEK